MGEKEQPISIYTSSGRRVKFDQSVDDYLEESSAAAQSTTSSFVRKPATPPRPVTPNSSEAKTKRSWSPLRRSRSRSRPKFQPPQVPQAPPAPSIPVEETLLETNGGTSVQDESFVSGMSVSLASLASASMAAESTNTTTTKATHTSKASKGSSSSSRRWFGRSSRSKSPQKRSFLSNNKLPTVIEASSPSTSTAQKSTAATGTVHGSTAATASSSGINSSSSHSHHRASKLTDPDLRRETQKLVRTLCTGTPHQPLSVDTVQAAHVIAVGLQEETQRLKHAPAEAAFRVAQLQRELKAAQKAASQLAADNLKYERQKTQFQHDMQLAEERMAQLEQALEQADAAAEETETLREQLAKAKQAMEELQNDNEDLQKAVKYAKAQSPYRFPRSFSGDADDAIAIDNDDDADHDNDAVNQSFEIQLNLQKDLAKVTARVQGLELENAHYAEKQTKMDELMRQLEVLQEERQAWRTENTELKEQLTAAEAAAATVVAEQDEASATPKDLVLSSSQLATATTIIGRLTEECKILTQREKELKEKLERIERKNKNQKEIFSTALEIKQVELKIYEQESNMNARKAEELQQCIDDLHNQQASIVAASPLPPAEDPEAVAALREQLHQTEDRLRDAETMHRDYQDAVTRLRQELEDRQARVTELETQLEEEGEVARQTIEQQATELSAKVSELSTVLQGKEDELHRIQAELEDERKESEYRTQVRVNELTEQLNDYETSLGEREERINQLQAKVQEQEELLTTAKQTALASRSDEVSEDGSRLEEIRRKRVEQETLLRAKMNRIHEMDQPDETMDTSVRSHTAASTSREDSPPPMMVFATPVPDARVVEMEASLKASDEQIEQLRRQLDDAQQRLSSVQRVTEQETDERYQELESSLKQSENRITELQAQISQAQTRLEDAQQGHEAEQTDLAKQIEHLTGERDASQVRLEEMQESLEKSNEEAKQLRTFMENMENKLGELRDDRTNQLPRVESLDSSTKGASTIDALEAELEEVRQQYEDECDKAAAFALKVEKLEEERAEALRNLQQAEFELLGSQKNMEELVNELDDSRAALLILQENVSKKNASSGPRVAELEEELLEAKERIAEADMKIDMLEQFIDAETEASSGSPSSNVNHTSSLQAEADIRRKDEEMKNLRSEVESTRKELLRSKERVENLEMERNYSTAKLRELSGIVKSKGSSEAEAQLYNKCIECAELSADKDDLSNQLRASQSRAARLEQEISATRQMVNDISQSWDSAASADENISRLKREHGESVARAASLSIELAESQMQIDKMADKLAAAERANKAYAEELNGRPGIFRAAMSMRSSTRSRSRSQERGGESMEVRRLKQRIALLEDENAAYEASLNTYNTLHNDLAQKSSG